MGAYDVNPRGELVYGGDTRSVWNNSNPPVDGSIGNLVDRFSGISVGGDDSSKESLFQVMKAVEAAEFTIKNQTAEMQGRLLATLSGEFHWLRLQQTVVPLAVVAIWLSSFDEAVGQLKFSVTANSSSSVQESRSLRGCYRHIHAFSLGLNLLSRNILMGVFLLLGEADVERVKGTSGMEENNHLRTELQKRTHELEKYFTMRKDFEGTRELKKLEALAPLKSSVGGSNSKNEQMPHPYKTDSLLSSVVSEERTRWADQNSSLDPRGTLVIHQNLLPKTEDPVLENHVDSQHYNKSKVDGTLKGLPGGQTGVDNAGISQFSSPSSRSISPSRYPKEGEYDPKFGLSGHGLMQMSEVNNSNNLLKQDLLLKVREHEEEIVLLRKHLADYSMKEAQIRNEKYILEKRIAHMRMAFDQQQQDLVEGASKALSYRQEIIEENIRLTYALQAAQQERTTFVSSLLPLLAEYSLQPPVHDAQSIVSNLKEKLIITEAKLKESQYQIAPWRPDAVNNSSFTPQSPSPQFAATPNTIKKSGLEIVPQPVYSHTQMPLSSPFNAQTAKADWEALGHQHAHIGGITMKNSEHDNLGRSSPSASSNPTVQDGQARLAATQGDAHDVTRFGEPNYNKHPSFNDLATSTEMEDSDAGGIHNGREPTSHWGSGSSPYMTPGHDDSNSSFSPYLPPVMEEPSSSFSEAAEDDPLPAIEGLQIAGEAFPGRELQACGYSINGTTSCNFEWVRYLEDGSVNYIVGAKQPNYLVTADDVDSYLAIEVQPLDDRKRKTDAGETSVLAVSAARHGRDPRRITDAGHQAGRSCCMRRRSGARLDEHTGRNACGLETYRSCRAGRRVWNHCVASMWHVIGQTLD
ncbi:hypothetical protein ACLOJK_001428 [Asimina triloba]